jgi:hypothetical protein
MKILNTSLQKDISERLLHLINVTHIKLEGLNKDLEYEFGESMLNKKIGESKFDKKFHQTLRDEFGSVIEHLINEGLNLVYDLGLDDDDFRDKLDLIFKDSEIYNGAYNSWIGFYPNNDSLELDTGYKNWWSRK